MFVIGGKFLQLQLATKSIFSPFAHLFSYRHENVLCVPTKYSMEIHNTPLFQVIFRYNYCAKNFQNSWLNPYTHIFVIQKIDTYIQTVSTAVCKSASSFPLSHLIANSLVSTKFAYFFLKRFMMTNNIFLYEFLSYA